ncbi:MAG: cysteine desulfurase [Kiritimatiellae bacterium]|nr:cysteine desulfurase [Kiritimatiellia bacterium]
MSPTEPRPLDPRALRADFPILGKPVRDRRRLVYLDNAATTQKPRGVIEAVARFYECDNANVHRAVHLLAERATEQYEQARKDIARFIGASSEREIVFTRGATESINMVAAGWGRAFIKAGDEIVVTEMEHHSNLIPWQVLAEEAGATLRLIPVREEGTLDLDWFRNELCPKTKLVTVTHMSNVLGTVNPVAEIAAAAHAAGAKVLVDAAQSVPHMPVDVRKLDCDFLAFSGHKMLAPMGSGVLWGREEMLEEMPPARTGGEMISEVHFLRATWAPLPHKHEAGTPNVAGAIGLGEAVRYLENLGMKAVWAHEVALTRYALERLAEVPGLRVFGKAPERGGIISFDVEGVHPHDLAQFADQDGVALRTGHHCAQPLLRKFGVGALTRASFYVYNDRDDVDQLVDSIRKARKFFRGQEER